MNALASYDQFLGFINCQLQPGGRTTVLTKDAPRRTVTISRQTGCGARIVAARLAEHLQARDTQASYPWTVFDSNLIEKVIEEHHLPKRIEQYMLKDRITEIGNIMDELFGLHPSAWTLVQHTSETILHLAEMGNAIIIGRAANIITAKLEHTVHVRLIAPLEQRIKQIQNSDHLDAKAAAAFVREHDLGRKRYARKYFEKDMDDPLLYHLVINTGIVSHEKAVQLIADAVLDASPHASPPPQPIHVEYPASVF